MRDRLRSSRTWRLTATTVIVVVVLGVALLVSQLRTQAQSPTLLPLSAM